jgi:hypothetical protein
MYLQISHAGRGGGIKEKNPKKAKEGRSKIPSLLCHIAMTPFPCRWPKESE